MKDDELNREDIHFDFEDNLWKCVDQELNRGVTVTAEERDTKISSVVAAEAGRKLQIDF